MTALPPGPSLSPLTQAVRLGSQPYAFLVEQARACGAVFTLTLPGRRRVVVVGDPRLVKALWSLTPEQINAADQPGLPINLGPNGLILLDGEQHARHRALLTPPLHGRALHAQAEDMGARARRMVADWPLGTPAAALPAFQSLALDVVLECALGRLPEEDSARIGRAFLRWMDGMLTPLSFALVQFGSARALRARQDRATAASAVRSDGSGPRRRLPWNRLADDKGEVVAYVRERLAAARAAPSEERHDVLALLAQARFDDGEGFSDAEVVDEIVTMGVGGVETTANTLAWCLHHLLENPDAMARAHEEVDGAFGEGPVTASVAMELPWLRACLDESMRLCPVSIASPRRLARDLVVDEWTIEAGTDLWVCSIVAHHDPARWPDPTEFRPQRFLDKRPSPNDWFPFGGGRRHCIGRAFALVEMRIALATLLHGLRFERAPGSTPTPQMRGMTVGPSDGVRVIAHARC